MAGEAKSIGTMGLSVSEAQVKRIVKMKPPTPRPPLATTSHSVRDMAVKWGTTRRVHSDGSFNRDT